MLFARRPLRRALLACFLLLSCAIWAAEKPRIRVDDYLINAEISPRTRHLTAHARVKFAALEDTNAAIFELHNALKPTKITDEKGTKLEYERFAQDSTVRVTLPTTLTKGENSTINFYYDGTLSSADDGPVEGLKLAYVDADTTYLLYAGRWFPVVGYGINRFTATMNITVPATMVVIGSGGAGAPAAPASSTAAAAPPPTATAPAKSGFATREALRTYTFSWEKPSFPGTIIAGQFEERVSKVGALNLRTFFKPNKKQFAPTYIDSATKEVEAFSAMYGPPPSLTLNIVEIPDDTVPSAWAPEIAALASRAVQDKVNYKLLADAIAHQWWGVSVSPASRADSWLNDGFARYSQARYVESAAGQGAYGEDTKDMAVSALAYDNVALASLAKLDPFSPEAQSLATDKGGMILHMLRWVEGDAAFNKTMRTFAQQFAGKPATTEDFKKIAEQNYGQPLTWFFTQWVDSTGAPEFKNSYTVFRVAKGFRVNGRITQDLDLFRMPVELKIETDGKPEQRRIEVSGTDSPYSVETFGKPRRISIDPQDNVLKNSPDLKVRVSILRGQQLVQQGDLAEALKEFQKSLDVSKNSSLAHYRIAEVFFLQHNYQSAANAYRDAINGDGEPKWTEVWSHIQLGKIFDLTGQRERAVNEYRQAIQTNDSTQGALDEARKYLATPYTPQKATAGA